MTPSGGRRRQPPRQPRNVLGSGIPRPRFVFCGAPAFGSPPFPRLWPTHARPDTNFHSPAASASSSSRKANTQEGQRRPLISVPPFLSGRCLTGVLALAAQRLAPARQLPGSAVAGRRGRGAGNSPASGLSSGGCGALVRPAHLVRPQALLTARSVRSAVPLAAFLPFPQPPPAGSWEVFDLLLQALNQEELRGGAFPCSPLHLYWPLGAFQRVSHRKTASYIIN